MAFDPKWIAAGGQASVGTIKSVFGLSQLLKANKGLKNFKFPQYTPASEYTDILNLYKQRAYAQEMPGQSLAENKLGAQTAYGMRAAEKYAPTGAAALEAATGLYGKQMDAVRDLGIQFANYRAQREAELSRAMQLMAAQKEKAWEYNQWYPAQVRYNELQAQKQAGGANLWGGQQDIVNSMMTFAGSSAAPQTGQYANQNQMGGQNQFGSNMGSVGAGASNIFQGIQSIGGAFKK